MMNPSGPLRGTLLLHLNGLYARYAEMEDEYCALSPSIRRCVSGPYPEERSYCAAILQWRPSSHEFKVERLFGTEDILTVETIKTGSGKKHDEICPIWDDFFDDIRKVDSMLKASVQPDLTEASKIMHEVETKAEWVRKSLQKIIWKPSPYPADEVSFTAPQSFDSWNELCLETMSGFCHVPGTHIVHEPKTPPSLTTAVGKVHTGSTGQWACDCGYNLRINAQKGTRRWFVYVPQPFLPGLEIECPAACMGWLLTPYNEYGQWDPERQYLLDPHTDVIDLPGIESRDSNPSVDMPYISRDGWLTWMQRHRGYLTEASLKKAWRMGFALHPGYNRSKTSGLALDLNKPLPPLPDEADTAAAESSQQESDEDASTQARESSPAPCATMKATCDNGMPTVTPQSPARNVPKSKLELHRMSEPEPAPICGSPSHGVLPTPKTAHCTEGINGRDIPGQTGSRPSTVSVDVDSEETGLVNERERSPYVRTSPLHCKKPTKEGAIDTTDAWQTNESFSRGRRPYARAASYERFTPYPQGRADAARRSQLKKSSSRTRRPYGSAYPQERFSMHLETNPPQSKPADYEPSGRATGRTVPSSPQDGPRPDSGTSRPAEQPKEAAPEPPSASHPTATPRPTVAPRPQPTDPRALSIEYNARWDALDPVDLDIPVPSPTLDADGLLLAAERTKGLQCFEGDFSQHTLEQLVAVQVFNFFTTGLNIAAELYEDPKSRTVRVRLIEGSETKTSVALKYLRRKELVMWHPDRLNLRTGTTGMVNNLNGSQELVVIIRTAVDELIGSCEAHLVKLQ